MAISLENNLWCLINRGNVSSFSQSQSVNQRSVWSYGGPLCENSVKCTVYNIQFTQYNVQCRVQKVHCRGNTVQFNLHYKLGTVVFFSTFSFHTIDSQYYTALCNCTKYSVSGSCTLCSVRYTFYTKHFTFSNANIHLKCTLQFSVYFTLNNVQCGFYNLHCTFCSIQCTL